MIIVIDNMTDKEKKTFENHCVNFVFNEGNGCNAFLILRHLNVTKCMTSLDQVRIFIDCTFDLR